MTTVSDLASLCLLDAGIIGQGQTASAQDANNFLLRLNFMLGEWQRKRWLIWHLVDTGITATGAQSYSVGPGGDFNIARPDKLESAFLRQNVTGGLPVDYPLEIINAREDYNRIRLKTLVSFPGSVFYDSAYPIGRVYFWPIAQGSIYELHITTKEVLAQFAGLTSTINLPPEYLNALHSSMVVRLRAAYRLPPDPVWMGMAKDARNTIRQANAQVPRLTMPGSVTRTGPYYNIYGDQP